MTFYESPRSCAEVALFNDLGEVLLVKRAREPWKGTLDLPGGFLEAGETAEAAMLREVEEELGLAADLLSKLRYVTAWPTEYPWGKEVYDVITTTFTAKILGEVTLRPGDDVSDYLFLHPKAIEPEMFSVSTYYDVIKQAYSLMTKATK